MIKTECITIDKTQPVILPPYIFYDKCPEPYEADCRPVYVTERPKPNAIIDFSEREILCFDGVFNPQPIPPNAQCWCGNGFNNNPAYYWIWEQCMANCINCPPVPGRGGYYLFRDCCIGYDGGGYNNCDGTGGLHSGYNKICCSPVCQSIKGKTKQDLYRNYTIGGRSDPKAFTYSTSYIDVGTSCYNDCCSSSDKIIYSAGVVFAANSGFLGPVSTSPNLDPSTGLPVTFGNIINPYTGEPLSVSLTDLGPVKYCSESINKSDELKISINIGERDEECASDAITSMFMDSIGYLPPIAGCRAEMYFNFQDDKNTRLIALLDRDSQNQSSALFNYYEDNDVIKDFKLPPNNTYDKNYPEIALLPLNQSFNALVFEAGFYCKRPTLFEYKDSNNVGSFLSIRDLKITYTFSLRNGELYMKPLLTFNMPNSFGRTADVFSTEEILISEISDFYKDITFMPDNSVDSFGNRRSNNTNCRVQVSLYGR